MFKQVGSTLTGLHFPAFGLNTERFSGKMWTRITLNKDNFYAVLHSLNLSCADLRWEEIACIINKLNDVELSDEKLKSSR